MADISSIAGLQRPLTTEDLELSRDIHNHLLLAEEQLEITDATLKALGELFVRNGVQDVFGIHLLHNHYPVPRGKVLLGVEAKLSENPPACWSKPVPIEYVVDKAVRGHIFRLQRDGTFAPYELEEGEIDPRAAGAAGAGGKFFHELASFLLENDLAELVALQVLSGLRHTNKVELRVGPASTLMLYEKELVGFDAPRITTGWSFHVGDDGSISCKGGNAFASKKFNQIVFKAYKTLSTVEDLREALRGERIIG